MILLALLRAGHHATGGAMERLFDRRAFLENLAVM
jgi:hypothetical protein